MLAAPNYLLKNPGGGMTMFDGCTLLLDEAALDNQVLINYITGTLDSVIGEEYAIRMVKAASWRLKNRRIELCMKCRCTIP